MSEAFGEFLHGMRVEDGAFRLHLPAAWMQGRTVYGGASAAAALASVLASERHLPPLRSAQVLFVGPLGEALEIRPSLLRRGRSAVSAEVRIFSGGTLGLVATFLFVAGRDSEVEHPAEPLTAAPDRGEAIRVPPEVAFARNFEMARAGSSLGRVPIVRRWARLRHRSGLHPLVELMLIADVLPPAGLKLFSRPGPLSTMNWQLNLLTPEPRTEEGWWLLGAEAEMAQGGFSSQSMQVWNARGERIASATQSVAFFA